MMAKNGRRSGFFFAVMALAILSLVLMTVQIWVTTFEQSDYRASQRFKGEAMRSILATVSDKALSDFANASAFYATYKLVDYTSNMNNGGLGTLQSDDPKNPNTGLVKKTIRELMLDGESEPNAGRPITYGDGEKESYTIEKWQEKVSSAASAMGFEITFTGVDGFNYWQMDPWTVGVEFDLGMDISDAELTMEQSKTLHAESSFSINGFLDPSIPRNDMLHRQGIDRTEAAEKQIFKLAAYDVPENVWPVLADETSGGSGGDWEGNGWFFGKVAYLDDRAEMGNASFKQYVLVVDKYNDSLPGYADQYGAVVLDYPLEVKSTPTPSGCVLEQQVNCLNCMQRWTGTGCDGEWEIYNNEVDVPVIVPSGNFNLEDDVAKVVRKVEGSDKTEQYLLIDNQYEGRNSKMSGYHRIWDITALRDMAICGFYVHDPDSASPSFFQRMVANSQYLKSKELGIESFVVGKWAGGADDDPGSDLSSRLDWEFYSSGVWNPPKIKGMMGCKSEEMCSSDDAVKIGVGHFRLSQNAIKRYKLEEIYYGSDNALND